MATKWSTARAAAQRPRSGRRRWVPALVLLVSSSVLTGCSDPQHDDDPLALQLSALRADNGLFAAVPFDSVATPGLAESGYGLQALDLGAGRRVRTPSEAELRRTFADQLRTDPLWSRVHLASILSSAWRANGTDLKTITGMQRPAGYFEDPAAPPAAVTDVGIRLLTSQAAVDALGRKGLTANNRDALVSWLASVGDDLTPGQLLCKLRLERSLGIALRSKLPEPASWLPAAVQKLGKGPTEESLYELTAQVLLRREQNAPMPPGGDSLREAMAKVRTTELDPQVVLRLAESLQYLGAPAVQVQAAVEPLRQRLTPAGLIATKPRIIGSLAATDTVQRIREESGLPTEDPQLAATLVGLRDETMTRGSALDRGLWLVAFSRAGGKIQDADREQVAAQLAAAEPGALTVQTVELWVTIRRLLVRLGYPVADSGGAGMTAIATGKDAGSRYARNVVIAATARLPASLQPPAPATLLMEAQSAVDSGSLKEADAALSAVTALGAVVPAELATRLRASLQRFHGCPGNDRLYHPTAGGKDCDAYTTLSATRLLNHLELPDAPPTGPTKTDR
jgi:hypothetical protein